MEDYGDNKKSFFNAGVAYAERISDLQNILNSARLNFQQINLESGNYNFMNYFNSLNSLMMEARGKADPKEKAEMEKVSVAIEVLLKYFPPYYEVETEFGSQQMWDVNNFDRLMRLLKTYEFLVRDCIEKHDLNSPNKVEDDEEEDEDD